MFEIKDEAGNVILSADEEGNVRLKGGIFKNNTNNAVAIIGNAFNKLEERVATLEEMEERRQRDLQNMFQKQLGKKLEGRPIDSDKGNAERTYTTDPVNLYISTEVSLKPFD